MLLHAESVPSGTTCYASADRVLDDFQNCWVKKSYIEQSPACDSKKAGDLELADQQAKCEQLGNVLGAGACKKEKKP